MTVSRELNHLMTSFHRKVDQNMDDALFEFKPTQMTLLFFGPHSNTQTHTHTHTHKSTHKCTHSDSASECYVTLVCVTAAESEETVVVWQMSRQHYRQWYI